MSGDDVRVDIKEWRTLTAGAHPHDPLVTSDGAIWYTGQMANLLGRLDPKRGQFRDYRLKTPDSGPHGLVADANGAIWFTASLKRYIGKLDPTTGDVREFKLPDPAARDPHTPVFDQKGILWFTVIGGTCSAVSIRDRRHQTHPVADNLFFPLWLVGELQRGSLLSRVRLKQNRPRRSGDV